AAGNRRWIAAIDRAVAGLTGEWIVTELAHCLAVTTESGETYFANGSCQCQAHALRTPLKHRAAARPISMCTEGMIQNPKDTEMAHTTDDGAELIADITATWSRRFPGESLADNLMARFKVNALGFLNTDFLRRVLDAIA